MSSKRKEKRSKVLTQYPCLPPQKWPIFLTLLRNFPKMKGAVTVNPLGNDFQPPPPRPTENVVHSGGGGDGSGYFNGIDRHLFMVRGLFYISSKLKENRQQQQQQQQHKKQSVANSPRFFQVESDLRSSARNRQILLIPAYKEATSNLAQTSFVHAGSTAPRIRARKMPFELPARSRLH